MPGVGIDSYAEWPLQTRDVADILAHLCGIDIDGADDAKPVTRRKLARDQDTNRTEAIQQHTNHDSPPRSPPLRRRGLPAVYDGRILR